MTALLEMKQNIKNFYGRHELYILPVLKFLLALVYFLWINSQLGFSSALDNIFFVLIFALLCAILPTNSIMWMGFIMIIAHCYALGIETAGFAVLLIILMVILFLRFSPSANVALLFTPLGCFLKIPAVVPLGCGLLGSPLTAAPGAAGVILTYFIKSVNEQASLLQNGEMKSVQKLKLILDSMMKNQEMWMTVVAFVVVILLVYLLRTRSMDYAWRIAIVVGIIAYVSLMLAGGLFLDLKISVTGLVITTVVSAVAGTLLEFFAFGGDYTRTEHLEFEDDDYYYYVKAVPKVSVGTSARQIKKINGKQSQDEYSVHEELSGYEQEAVYYQEETPQEELLRPDENVDFEKKLEESLRDL